MNLINNAQIYIKVESQNTHPVIYSLIQLLFAKTALTIKLVPQIPSTKVLYVRLLFIIIAIKFLVGDDIDSYPEKYITRLQWRGLCGGACTFAWFLAVKLIQSSEVIVISKVSPLWTALIAAYFYKIDNKNYIQLFHNFPISLTSKKLEKIQNHYSSLLSKDYIFLLLINKKLLYCKQIKHLSFHCQN